MKRIIFEKLTIKEKKRVLAGVNDPGDPPNSEDPPGSPGLDGSFCTIVKPINPDSECAQGGI